MIIAGAGMTGLLAGQMLRAYLPTIIEKQKSLPHNHEALLRFRTDAVAREVGTSFRKVRVQKAMVSNNMFVDRPNPYVCNQYSLKVTGDVLDRSVWNLDPVDRYIAPRNLPEIMSAGLDIEYGTEFKGWREYPTYPVISTLPMPILMKMVGWKDMPKFEWKPIWVVSCDVEVPFTDVHQTIYFTDLDESVYRASLIGNRLVVECTYEVVHIDDGRDDGEFIRRILAYFGIHGNGLILSNIKVTQQQFGKIIPIDDDMRKDFIYTMTREFGIYSVGRFATWRQILMDDVVGDIRVVQRLIAAEGRSASYAQSLAASK